jgi:hypothetical protein
VRAIFEIPLVKGSGIAVVADRFWTARPGSAAPWHGPFPAPAPQDGFLLLAANKFAAPFAANVPKDKAEFMAQSQVPWGLDALNGSVTEPAWRNKPSWYLVASDDKMIPPPAQRLMSKRAGSTVVRLRVVMPSTFRGPTPLQLPSKRLLRV